MSIPKQVIDQLVALTGKPQAEIVHSFDAPGRTSIRINTNKWTHEPKLECVSWCETGYFLPERPLFVTDPLFHGGAYYVQEASSMFLEQVVKHLIPEDEPITALDLCAAPGGKSTHLRSILPEGSTLISNEVIRPRASILLENLTKWGHPDVAVIHSDPKFIGQSGIGFDLMVVDAPCSGEGLFRKDRKAIEEWSEENVHLCALRQRRILADVWPALRENGVLIYSTCTFNRAENEENMLWLKQTEEAVPLRIPFSDPSILETETDGIFGYRFLPDRSLGEGFFLCAFRKTGGGLSEKPIKGKIATIKKSPASSYLQPTSHSIVDVAGTHYLVSDKLMELHASLQKLRALSIGTELGTVKGNDFRPAQALANSILLSDAVSKVELDTEEALEFLSRGSVNQLIPAGWRVVAHSGVPLGFVKSLGNRCNTFFPKEWRIRTDVAQYPKPYFSLRNL